MFYSDIINKEFCISARIQCQLPFTNISMHFQVQKGIFVLQKSSTGKNIDKIWIAIFESIFLKSITNSILTSEYLKVDTVIDTLFFWWFTQPPFSFTNRRNSRKQYPDHEYRNLFIRKCDIFPRNGSFLYYNMASLRQCYEIDLSMCVTFICQYFNAPRMRNILGIVFWIFYFYYGLRFLR